MFKRHSRSRVKALSLPNQVQHRECRVLRKDKQGSLDSQIRYVYPLYGSGHFTRIILTNDRQAMYLFRVGEQCYKVSRVIRTNFIRTGQRNINGIGIDHNRRLYKYEVYLRILSQFIIIICQKTLRIYFKYLFQVLVIFHIYICPNSGQRGIKLLEYGLNRTVFTVIRQSKQCQISHFGSYDTLPCTEMSM